jgi:hypothetical protein
MPCHRTTGKQKGVIRPHALFTIHQLQQLEYVLLGDILTDTAARHVPGIEHIPVLYAPYVLGNWRARYRDFAPEEAERLTKDLANTCHPPISNLDQMLTLFPSTMKQFTLDAPCWEGQ